MIYGMQGYYKRGLKINTTRELVEISKTLKNLQRNLWSHYLKYPSYYMSHSVFSSGIAHAQTIKCNELYLEKPKMIKLN